MSDVLSQIFLGKEHLSHYSRFNEMLPADCQRVASDRRAQNKKEGSKGSKDEEEQESKRERSVSNFTLSLLTVPSPKLINFPKLQTG